MFTAPIRQELAPSAYKPAANQESPIPPAKSMWFWEKGLWLLAMAVLMAYRIPGVLRGRFWAEEGTVFFSRAWSLPWYKALFLSYGGYLSLVGNLGGVLANCLVPLEKACFVPTILALLVQLCPLAVLALSNQRWLQERRFFVVAMLLIVTMPMCEGVWLNTVGSQYHLNLCVAFILALEVGSGWVGYFRKGLLLLAGLTGLGPACIIPLYALRAFIDRSKARAIQCAILAAGTLTQLIFFYRPEGRHVAGVAAPAVGIDPLLLLNIFFVKHIMGPALGFRESLDVAGTWTNDYLHGTFNLIPCAAATILLFGIFAYWVWRARLPETKWFFLSGMALALISYVAAWGQRYYSLGVGINTRYAFGPQILFEITLLTIACSSKGWKSVLSKSILIWVLVIGAHEYFWVPSTFSEGPTWRSQVREWRKDPSYAMKIWPAGWAMQLKPH